MTSTAFIGTMLCGLGYIALPIAIPFFYCAGTRRPILFYFVGLGCCILCFRVFAVIIWALLCSALGRIIASIRHEDYRKSIEYGFDLVVPGMKQGYGFLGLLLMLVLGTLLSVIMLRMIKRAFFGPVKPSAS